MNGSNPSSDHRADAPETDAAWRPRSRAVLLAVALGTVVFVLRCRYAESAREEYDPPSRWTVEPHSAAREPFAASAARDGW